VTSSSYEIRITGILPPEALLDFENLTASVEPVATVVHGQLPDQAALHGLLARLEMLGVQVLEVRRLHEQALPGSPDHQVRSAPDQTKATRRPLKPAHPGPQPPTGRPGVSVGETEFRVGDGAAAGRHSAAGRLPRDG